MANKSVFSSIASVLPRANATNKAGGPAYKLPAKHALAHLAATGTFGNVFYASAHDQLDQLRTLIEDVDDNVFLAKLAVYARERAFMKDMPAALLVTLSTRDTQLMHRVFDRVVDNGRVLRTVFQMVRSGQFGRKGLSSSLQRAFKRWFSEASTQKLLSASIGRDPSVRDVLRMARPTPRDNTRRATFGWLTDKPVDKWAPASKRDLPEAVKLLQEFRSTDSSERQARIAADLQVRWDLLADAAKGPLVWKAIARQMGPQALRMNLNTLLRHGVFAKGNRRDGEMIDYVAGRIADAEAIRRSRQFPYQFFAVYLNVSDEVPHKIKAALHDAAEIACGNVPQLPAPVVVGLDTSGSMGCSVTGWHGKGRSSKVRCVDVAALFAAAILRRNPDSVVIPFDTKAYEVKIDPSDSILSLAERLSQYGGGGTDCSQPLRRANGWFTSSMRKKKRAFAGVILVSDNESWINAGRPYAFGRGGATGVMSEWKKFRKTQIARGIADPKLVCIDIAPYGSTQAPDRKDILNVGGFSDAVFNVVGSFLDADSNRFVREIESVEL